MAQSSQPNTDPAVLEATRHRSNATDSASVTYHAYFHNVTINNDAGSPSTLILGTVQHLYTGGRETAVINTTQTPVQNPRPEDINTVRGTQSTFQNNGTRTGTSGGSSTKRKRKDDAPDTSSRPGPGYGRRQRRQFTVSKRRNRVICIGTNRCCEDCSTTFSPVRWETGGKHVLTHRVASTPAVASIDQKTAFAILSAAVKRNKEQAGKRERSDEPSAEMSDDQSPQSSEPRKIVKLKLADRTKANGESQDGNPDPSKTVCQNAPCPDDASTVLKTATTLDSEFESTVEVLSPHLETAKKRRRMTWHQKVFPDLHRDVLEIRNKTQKWSGKDSSILPSCEDEGYGSD